VSDPLLQQPLLDFFERRVIPVFVMDPDGAVLWLNSAASRAFEITLADARGKSAARDLPDAARTEVLAWSRAWRRGESTGGRLLVRLRDGQLRPYWVHAQPLRDARGALGCVVFELVDECVFGTAISRFARRAGHDVHEVIAALADEIGAVGSEGEASFAELRLVEPGLAALSDREWEVAQRIGRGDRVRQVAAELGITVNTVRNHLKAVFRKLGVGSQLELVERLRKGAGQEKGPD
jgi:DNA-binding CsgD family transcriptional regulator